MQTADRMRVAHARWFFPINGKSSAGPQRAVQVERSADECKVRESLREVSQGLATMTGLFRIEAAPMLIAKTIGCIAAAKLAALGELAAGAVTATPAQLRDLVDRGALPAQAATTLASLWPGAGAPLGSEIAELLAATDRVVAECRGVEEATVVSAINVAVGRVAVGDI
jgi:hypothetical protein